MPLMEVVDSTNMLNVLVKVFVIVIQENVNVSQVMKVKVVKEQLVQISVLATVLVNILKISYQQDITIS